MFNIRPIKPSDKEAVRDVCVVTAGGIDTQQKKKVLWHLFCDYYVDIETDCSFVAVDENDEAKGYLFCAKDYKVYAKNYRKYILPKLFKDKFFAGIEKHFDLILQGFIGKKYPAHLHIDIKPEGQRMGLGHKMMDELMKRLYEKNVPSVYLIVGAGNEKGNNFYKKYGFELKGKKFGNVYAIDVEKKYKEIIERDQK